MSTQERIARMLCRYMDDDWEQGRELHMRHAAEVLLEAAASGGDPDALGRVSHHLNGRTVTLPTDEPVFLLRGQDQVAAATVRYWADTAQISGASMPMVLEARTKAEQMDAWPVKKVPDLPRPDDEVGKLQAGAPSPEDGRR